MGRVGFGECRIALIAASLAAGCSSSVASHGAASGGTSAGGSSGAQSGGSGGAQSGGSGEAQSGGSSGTQSGGSGGAQDGGPGCIEPYNSIDFKISTSGGKSYACTSNSPYGYQPKWSTTGIVKTSSADSIVVDSCAPDANCAPMLSTISVKAEGLALSIPVGSIVSVHYVGPSSIQSLWLPCSGRLVIQSVADWGGAHDPAGDGKLYVAAVDGSIRAPAGVPFKVTLAKLGCSTYGPSGGMYALSGDYAFRFSSSSGSSNVVVRMGETALLVTPGQKLHVHDVRSFQSEGTDANWDWAYWAAP